LILWAENNRKKHPRYTNFTLNFKDTLDYIYYSTNNVRVLKILDMPSHD